MTRSIRATAAFVIASLCLGSAASAKVVTFDIPGEEIDTPMIMNDSGQVTGLASDASGAHGFLRQPDGNIVMFDVSKAQATVPTGISATGVITGCYYGPGNQANGFERAVDGTITTFKARGARVTSPQGATSNGWSVGMWATNRGEPIYQGFLRSPSGKKQEFSVPNEPGGTVPVAVNNALTVVGEAYLLRSEADHAFIRTVDGTVTLLPDGLYVVAINDSGTIAGISPYPTQEGFVRASDGTITPIAAPNDPMGTYTVAINNSGTVAGDFTDSSGIIHGFLRIADGTFTPFDPKGAITTHISTINNKGAIAGFYVTKDNVLHGFVGKP
jgi:hypothetical protein